MRIVHITTIDEGGAYKAVVRMREALQSVGVDSEILLRDKLHQENIGEVYLDSGVKRFVSKFKNALNLLFSRQQIACEMYGSDVSQNALVKNADIIVIHWCNSFLSYNTIRKLFDSGKKMVFFMHDTWLFTGGCHVNLDCVKYESGCGNCPYINGKKEKDLSYRNFVIKQKLFEEYSFSIIGPSKWIVDCAYQSKLIINKRITYIPNCIDGAIFGPIPDIGNLKRKYDIPVDKKVVLFGAAFNGTKNTNKGFGYLLEALKSLDEKEYFLLVFGECDEKNIKWRQEYKLLGYIYSEQEMAEIYNIADVYVSPSLQESFGFTVCEAMSCGTPVVAFPVGGNKEQIVHRHNGYLAGYKDVLDLAQGIVYCTQESNNHELSVEAHKSSMKFHYSKVGNLYAEYFKALIE